MNEQELKKQFETYGQLAKTDKNVDVAGLMINALQQEQSDRLSDKQKRWAYLISIGAPPFGLIYAVKFYFSAKSDAKNAALMCVVLTLVSILLYSLLSKVILGSTPVNLKQIQQITPSDINQLTQ